MPGRDDAHVRYDARESISFAFVTALQLLPPRQRATLVLRDVLGFDVREVAQILGCSEDSVARGLARARSTLDRRLAATAPGEPPPAPRSPAELAVVEELARAFEASDVDAIVSLLSEDVRLTMPPRAVEYRGRALAERVLGAVMREQRRRYRMLPTRANGQPAFGLYARDPPDERFRALGLLVVTLAGSRIAALTLFDSGVLPLFGLPRSLSNPDA
jgi:RNA polymerase sigma-70 factor (ECF subfamily)